MINYALYDIVETGVVVYYIWRKGVIVVIDPNFHCGTKCRERCICRDMLNFVRLDLNECSDSRSSFSSGEQFLCFEYFGVILTFTLNHPFHSFFFLRTYYFVTTTFAQENLIRLISSSSFCIILRFDCHC